MLAFAGLGVKGNSNIFVEHFDRLELKLCQLEGNVLMITWGRMAGTTVLTSKLQYNDPIPIKFLATFRDQELFFPIFFMFSIDEYAPFL